MTLSNVHDHLKSVKVIIRKKEKIWSALHISAVCICNVDNFWWNISKKIMQIVARLCVQLILLLRRVFYRIYTINNVR